MPLVQAFRKSQQPAVDKLKEPILDEITQELVRRYGVNFTKQETASLWSLCKQVSLMHSLLEYARIIVLVLIELTYAQVKAHPWCVFSGYMN